jgi:hypothetical protein
VTRPLVNLADVALRDGGDGKNFVAKLGRVGSLIGAQKLGCQLHIVAAGRVMRITPTRNYSTSCPGRVPTGLATKPIPFALVM